MRIPEREKRDLLLLAAIVLLGVLLMFLSGQFAIRMLPRWSVPSNMQSNIDPNLGLDSGSDALASVGLAPLRPEIQTPPAWQRTFLTPQANLDLLNEVPVVVVAPVTSQPTWTATQAAAPTETQNPTATATLFLTPTPFPTNTMVYVFPTWTFTPKPPEPTITLTPSLTFTPTYTPTDTPVPTPTLTLTFTPTIIPTDTPVPTYTNTPIDVPAVCNSYLEITEPGNYAAINGWTCFSYTNHGFENGAIFIITSNGVEGHILNPGGCPPKHISHAQVIEYGAGSDSGTMFFRISNTVAEGSLVITIAEWNSYPTCP